MTVSLIPCPLCKEADRFLPVNVPFADEHIGNYRRLYGDMVKSEWKVCGRCGFVHQNPRPSIESLNAIYADGEYHTVAAPLAWNDRDVYMRFARWYYDAKVQYALVESNLQPGRVFEMGFGYGGALALFAERGWKTTGREPDPRLAAFARDTLHLVGPTQGFVDASLWVDPVDLVWSNHAFEHIADLDTVMKALRSIMKPGGYIFTAVPTYAENRSDMSLRWMNAAHYSIFTRSSLDQMMARHGFEPASATYRGWRKEIDDIWHLARYTGVPTDPTKFYEDPERVAHYINVTNPRRSWLLSPIFSNYAQKYQRAKYVKDSLSAVARRLLQF